MRHEALLVSGLALGLLAGCGEEGPPPEAAVRATRDLGLVESAASIRGRDGGYSLLRDGQAVFFFGDTILASPGEDGSSWRNNTCAASADLDARDGLGGFVEREDALGAPVECFPRTAQEAAFNLAHQGDPCQTEPCGARYAVWPGAVVDDPERARALAFYHLIYAEPGDFNFSRVGSSLAVWPDGQAAPERPELAPGAEHPTQLFPLSDPAFGSAALVDQDRLYAYACETDWVAKPCRLGRAPLADALDRARWEFWAGEAGWVDEPARAEPVMEGNDMLAVGWNRHLERFLAVYNQPMDHRVMLRTAPRPEGPWSAPLEAFECLAPTEGSGWIYDALPHPELAREDGRVQYLTFSRATGFLMSELRLVELELE
ncbi:MAG TPA: DUF4185 domain-containing protein [Myxococcota bacterium]|nr:DUF4185 domain-containing protein [Myxococcota bacterium]HRY94488.1 DUF4185 domain-containing protein [Myxococcota bacterium]HSA20064.1 DUF4185 domain-containing protein [Myxococcota bacterium]